MTHDSAPVSRPRWAAMTALGALAGLVLLVGGAYLAMLIARTVVPAGSGEDFGGNPQSELVGHLWPLIGGIGFGLVVGLLQGNVLKRHRGDVKVGYWTAGTMVGAMVGFTIAARLFDALEDTLRVYLESFFIEESLVPVAVVGLAFGIVVGLVVGLFQWLSYRRVGAVWPAASAVTWGAGFSLMLVLSIARIVSVSDYQNINEIASVVGTVALTLAAGAGLVALLLPPRVPAPRPQPHL